MYKKKSAFLKEENLLTLLSQNTFIVPEIQREYVWGNHEKVILRFLSSLLDKIGNCCPVCHLPSTNNKINIGFLYSYKPEYVKVEQERFLDEYLIDGQQRFTTLFLLLFYCAIRESRKAEFSSLIRFEENVSMNFDFRVRNLTKYFLLELVENIHAVEEFSNLTSQTWFLADYQNDISIQAMLKTLQYIQEKFANENKYYTHLLSHVVFWHFKTEATSQGEELYITMNARGEDLSNNEINKADLMRPKDTELKAFGQKWETWQDLFWKNRGNNVDADNGLDSFIACLKRLENKDNQPPFSLTTIEKYYKIFKFLTDLKEANTTPLWLKNCVNEMWEIFNKNATDWSVDFKDSNKGTEHSRMVFVWSIFYFLSKQNELNFEDKKIKRFIRLFYVRFKNYSRTVESLFEMIDEINEKGLWDCDLSKDENLKHNFYKNKNTLSITDCEKLIWDIENHPLNLNGRDKGSINISHLVDFDSNPTLEELQKIRKTFDVLFSNNTTQLSPILKSILLFYKEMGVPHHIYYNRYKFDDAREIIRRPPFMSFFRDFLKNKTSLEDFLKDLKMKFLKNHKIEIKNAVTHLPEKEIGEKLCYFNLLLSPEELWEMGHIIVEYERIEEPLLFENSHRKIYNLHKTFNGNSNRNLWEVILGKHENPLVFLKQQVKILKQ